MPASTPGCIVLSAVAKEDDNSYFEICHVEEERALLT